MILLTALEYLRDETFKEVEVSTQRSGQEDISGNRGMITKHESITSHELEEEETCKKIDKAGAWVDWLKTFGKKRKVIICAYNNIELQYVLRMLLFHELLFQKRKFCQAPSLLLV